MEEYVLYKGENILARGTIPEIAQETGKSIGLLRHVRYPYYFVINIDEPYAKVIYEVLKAGQIAKGQWPEGDITFEEWKQKTFRDNYVWLQSRVER